MHENDRSLPWKNERDPYRIWLSEIMLQQTRAQQGLPYYLRFTEKYPTIQKLAGATDEEVFRLWQGLGYYNRCKNMLATARQVSSELNGRFPNTYDEILSLKGVGPYTAAAISSFAYNLPNAVVDGNVYRVLARFFGIEKPIDTTAGKQYFTSLAHDLLDHSNSAGYNQAIMDLGATICTPRTPICANCPLKKKCVATQYDLAGVLPVKNKKQTVTTRYFNYVVLKWKDKVWVRKRTGNDIWQNLYEFYLIETNDTIDNEEVLNTILLSFDKIPYRSFSYGGHISQRLTHRLIRTGFFIMELSEKPAISLPDANWLPVSDLKKTPFPKTLLSFLEKNFYFSIH